MPAVLIAYTIPRAFQLIYSPKGEGRRPEEKNEDREGKDADGGVAAALSRGKVWDGARTGRTDGQYNRVWVGRLKLEGAGMGKIINLKVA